MMAKVKGLGRGLDALLGDDLTAHDGEERLPTRLPVGQLQPGRYQPRTHMDVASLEALSDSIRAQGLLQPILVRPAGHGHYEIIAGERRWRAAQMAGLHEVPVLVRNIPDESTLAVALIENIQRENLNPLEEAQGLERLIREFGMTHDTAAEAVGRSRSAVTNLLRLLNLNQNVRSLMMTGDLDMGHARALLPLDEGPQQHLAQQVILHGWSVRDTERQVQKLLKDARRPQSEVPPAAKTRDLINLQNELSDLLGTEVTLKEGKAGMGALSIKYHNLDQLEGILQRLRQG